MSEIIVCDAGKCMVDCESPKCCFYCDKLTTCTDKCTISTKEKGKLCNYQIPTKYPNHDANRKEDAVDCNRYNENEVFTCIKCGEDYESADEMYTDEDGDYWCDDCYHDYFTSCANCDEYYHNEDMSETSDGLVCESCYNDYYSRCERCDTYVRDGDTQTALNERGNSVTYCNNCFSNHTTSCFRCDESFTDEVNMRSHDGNYYCPECFEEAIGVCESCGESYEKDLMKIVNGERYCIDCVATCVVCGETFKEEDTTNVNGRILCTICNSLEEEQEERRTLQ